MKPHRIALLLFMTITMALMAIFSAIVLWPYGWHYSSNALLTALGTSVLLWNGDRLI